MKQADNGGLNPYVAGALVGFLIIFTALFSEQYFGASTAFVRIAGLIEKIFAAERVAQMDYFRWFTPRVDWQMMFFVGILLGSLLSALTSSSFKLQAVPDMWARRFGPSPVKRGLAAFAGGIIAMFGARLANG